MGVEIVEIENDSSAVTSGSFVSFISAIDSAKLKPDFEVPLAGPMISGCI